MKIPSRVPQFGCLWEAAVKATKGRVVGQQELSIEERLTVLQLIEVILNSRTLTPLSIDPIVLVRLTPSHFLIGGSFHPIVTNDVQTHWLIDSIFFNKSRKTFGYLGSATTLWPFKWERIGSALVQKSITVTWCLSPMIISNHSKGKLAE